MIDIKETIRTLLTHINLSQGMENSKWVYKINDKECSEDEFNLVLKAIEYINEER